MASSNLPPKSWEHQSLITSVSFHLCIPKGRFPRGYRLFKDTVLKGGLISKAGKISLCNPKCSRDYCRETNNIRCIVILVLVCSLLHCNYMHILYAIVQADIESRSSSRFMLFSEFEQTNKPQMCYWCLISLLSISLTLVAVAT